MGLRSWFSDQTRAYDEYSKEVRTRVVPALQPMLEAEAARGNLPDGPWRDVPGQYPNELWGELWLMFPHDEAALRAEFEIDPEILWLSDQGFGVLWSSSVLAGDAAKRKPVLVEQWRSARASWWEQWEAGPQQRRRLPQPAPGDR